MKNPLTIEAFAEWCESKPADERYEYMDDCGCAFFQYLQDRGFQPARVDGYGWYSHDGNQYHPLPAGVEDPLCQGDSTFGALAARLREVAP